MSVHPIIRSEPWPPPVHSTLNLLVIGIFGRAWLATWLRLFPSGATTVRWTLHDDLSSAPSHLRWRRAIGFFAQLPSFAADQAEAESTPATQTGGQRPEGGPPKPNASALGWSPRRVVRDVGFALAAMIAVVVALVTWVNGFGTLFELFDRHAVTGAATGAIAVTLVYGTLPMALVYNHRFFAWTPARRADRDETVQQRVTWWLASAGFGLLALVIYAGVLGEYMDNYDWRGIDLSFGAAFGMAVVALLGVTPLAWVVRHRYWVGRSAGSE